MWKQTHFAMGLITASALAAVSACGGDSDSGRDATQTPVRSEPTVRVLESPTADSCGVGGLPQALEEGQEQTVRGTVVGTSISEDERGRSIILELGAEGGGTAYAVGIPESAAMNFTDPPQEMYRGKQICVQGTVIDHRGVPTIFVSTPAEVREEEPGE